MGSNGVETAEKLHNSNYSTNSRIEVHRNTTLQDQSSKEKVCP